MALAATLNPEDAAHAMALHARTTAMAKAQVHEALVRDALQRAKDNGISADLQWLRTMSTQDLAAWVYSNLG